MAEDGTEAEGVAEEAPPGETAEAESPPEKPAADNGADSESGLELSELESGAEAPAAGGDAGDSMSAAVPLPEKDTMLRSTRDLEAVYDIPVQVSAVLGKTHMQVSQLLKLGRGAVVELDRKVGEAIDIYVNNRLVARGEVVVVEERLGVTMTEIIKSDQS